MKEALEYTLTISTMCELNWKNVIYEPGSEPSPDIDDELSKLQNYNKYPLFISYLIYDVFVAVKTDQDIFPWA